MSALSGKSTSMQHKAGIIQLLDRVCATAERPRTASAEMVEEHVLRQVFGPWYDVIVAPTRRDRTK